MKYTVEVTSDGMIRIPSFIKTGTSVQAILSLSLRNLNDCNVGKKEKCLQTLIFSGAINFIRVDLRRNLSRPSLCSTRGSSRERLKFSMFHGRIFIDYFIFYKMLSKCFLLLCTEDH
jgi:hypothetical protein